MTHLPSIAPVTQESLRSSLEDCVLQWEGIFSRLLSFFSSCLAHVALLDNILRGIPTSLLSSENNSSFLLISEAILCWVPEDSSFLLNSVRCIQVGFGHVSFHDI